MPDISSPAAGISLMGGPLAKAGGGCTRRGNDGNAGNGPGSDGSWEIPFDHKIYARAKESVGGSARLHLLEEQKRIFI